MIGAQMRDALTLPERDLTLALQADVSTCRTPAFLEQTSYLHARIALLTMVLAI